MKTTSRNLQIADGEWRFDRINPDEHWAACMWEYCREYFHTLTESEISLARKRGQHTRHDRLKTLGLAIACDEFPHTPWMDLTDCMRAELMTHWIRPPGDIEDYRLLEYADGKSSAERRALLRNQGKVVFDLGAPPRDAITPQRAMDPATIKLPTRANLLQKFEAWLDSNPEWWDGRGKRGTRQGTAGKRSPREGLRVLAYSRLRRKFDGNDAAVSDFLKRNASELAWWQVHLSSERARKLPAEAARWQKMVCQS